MVGGLIIVVGEAAFEGGASDISSFGREVHEVDCILLLVGSSCSVETDMRLHWDIDFGGAGSYVGCVEGYDFVVKDIETTGGIGVNHCSYGS